MGAVAMAALSPWAVFAVASMISILVDHHVLGWLLYFLASCAAVGFLVLAVLSCTRWRELATGYVLSLCCLAVIAGVLVGYSISADTVANYWQIARFQEYTDVAPDEPAAAHVDASLLVFAEGTRPDVTQAIGLMARGAVFCVAPIASSDAGEKTSPDIQYWAAGRDCCAPGTAASQDYHCGAVGKNVAHTVIPDRTSPLCCDDVGTLSSLTGMVLRERTRILPWKADDLAFYEQAMQMAVATYGLVSHGPLYVSWVADVGQAKRSYWNQAWWDWVKAVLYAFCVCLFIGAGVTCIQTRADKMGEWHPGGGGGRGTGFDDALIKDEFFGPQDEDGRYWQSQLPPPPGGRRG